MDKWLLDHLVCPRDRRKLELIDDRLVCEGDHSYAVVDDIPVMLIGEAESTHGYIEQTFAAVAAGKVESETAVAEADGIDPFVQAEVPYTSGNLYFPIQHKLTRYPIPKTHLWQGRGERLLDIGCNWGRWSIAAARKGFKPIGIDPSLKAVMAARRVANQLNVQATFIVGDARFLPFENDSFDVVFSYGVYQHLSKENVRVSLKEVRRVLKDQGQTLFQMPNKFGIRQYQQHRRRGFTEGKDFEVRYWKPSELMRTFSEYIGSTQMITDCYFGLGVQVSDIDLMPLKYKAVIAASETLRKLSTVVRPLMKLADSVYLRSVNEKSSNK